MSAIDLSRSVVVIGSSAARPAAPKKPLTPPVPLSKLDDREVDFCSIVVQREGLGVTPLSDRAILKIQKMGYDAFFIDKMNSEAKIGTLAFLDLTQMDKLELTIEFIVFHRFRDKINTHARKKIAALLLKEAQKKIN